MHLGKACSISQITADVSKFQKGSGSPFVGDMHRAGVEDDGLGGLAGDLVCARLLEEVAHHLPEQRPIRVPLLEVERSRSCATRTTFTCAGLLGRSCLSAFPMQHALCFMRATIHKSVRVNQAMSLPQKQCQNPCNRQTWQARECTAFAKPDL